MTDEPLVVEVTRGHNVESRHEVDAVVVDINGGVVHGWGDLDRMVMPRSAAKPIQALPLIETGAAAGFELDQIETALACASHNGERAHVDRVLALLDRLGLSSEDLECGEQAPVYRPAFVELIEAGNSPGAEHNNCSGKHTGFLTVCRHLDLPTAGYITPEHPLQADYVTPALSEWCRYDVADQEPAADGCGIPVWQIPMSNLAAGWARLVTSEAGVTLLEAMMAEPFFVAGTDRSSTDLMQRVHKRVAVKGGAEGVYCGVVLDEGYGITLKVRDGAHRAADVAMEHVLEVLGTVEGQSQRLVNWAGTDVGVVRVAG